MRNTPILTLITRFVAICAVVLLIGGCALFIREPGIGRTVNWTELDGWNTDRHAQAWPAFLHSCARLDKRDPWKTICGHARGLSDPADIDVRRFFETWFVPRRVIGKRGRRDGLITGYYEPLLHGSRERDGQHRFPIYSKPPDLLDIRLDSVYPELKDKRLRGRLMGGTIVPYFSRAEVDSGQSPLAGNEILWVDDPIALFFLHIQGSGRVQLPDGHIVAVGYADQNGHPYRSIGRRLIELGELERDAVTMFSIRDWLRENPGRAVKLLNSNPSYVFFTLRENADTGPVGSMNTPLTAERSVAIDPRVIPLGTPLWLDTNVPGERQTAYRRLVIAQDTGGAIRGTVRADLFWGRGAQAETMAGRMKERGRIYLLTPKPSAGAGRD